RSDESARSAACVAERPPPEPRETRAAVASAPPSGNSELPPWASARLLRRDGDGQPLPAFPPASLEHRTSGGRRHAGPKPVRALTPTIARLVGSLHPSAREVKRHTKHSARCLSIFAHRRWCPVGQYQVWVPSLGQHLGLRRARGPCAGTCPRSASLRRSRRRLRALRRPLAGIVAREVLLAAPPSHDALPTALCAAALVAGLRQPSPLPRGVVASAVALAAICRTIAALAFARLPRTGHRHSFS